MAVTAVMAVMAVMAIIIRKKQRKHRAWKKKMNCTFFARSNFSTLPYYDSQKNN